VGATAFFFGKKIKIKQEVLGRTAYFPFSTYRIFDTTWTAKKTLRPRHFNVIAGGLCLLRHCLAMNIPCFVSSGSTVPTFRLWANIQTTK
jgi:hypothetical protein